MPARSTRSRCTPAYQSGNIAAVSGSARNASAAVSAAVGGCQRSPTTSAATSSIGTAKPQAYAETRTGPSRGSSGAAISENATSPANAPAAHASPALEVFPAPCTRAVPATTTIAAAVSRPVGRSPRTSGPSNASAIGAAPTAVPTMAGSAWRKASSTHTLNATSPVAASAASRHSSPAVGRTGGRRLPAQASTAASAPAATAYRIAWPVSSG
jgi:hypothetical protein